MNRNALKVIACVTMLIDHIGVILFPGQMVFRYIGRLAMPIFAFFIGEGCLYTRDRKKYFLRVFLMGLVCQGVYLVNSLVNKTDDYLDFNILLTFSCSLILCRSFLEFKEALSEKKEKSLCAAKGMTFFFVLIFFWGVCVLQEKGVLKTSFDYGFFGIILPCFAAVSKEKKVKLSVFAAGLVIFILGLKHYRFDVLLSVCTFIPMLFLLLYNGKPGKLNMKWGFYLFYPMHLAVLYIISMLI